MRHKDTPNGQFETPPEYGLAPCVGAVRLPKPGADLAWSAPGWDFPPSARRFSSGRMELVVCKSRVKADRKNVVGAVCNVQSGTDEIGRCRIDQRPCFVEERSGSLSPSDVSRADCNVESGC